MTPRRLKRSPPERNCAPDAGGKQRWTRHSPARACVPQCAPGCFRVLLGRRSKVQAAGEPACRPGSVHPRERGPTAIHLGLPLLAASCGLPASIGRAALNRSRSLPAARTPRRIPSDLAPGGVYRAAAVTCGAGGLLHHRFTLTSGPGRSPAPRRSVFCGTFPRVTPGRRYRPPCPAEPGPSSPGRKSRRGRPAGSPAVTHSIGAHPARPTADPPGPTRAAADARCR
jgi:hypothetical protein